MLNHDIIQLDISRRKSTMSTLMNILKETPLTREANTGNLSDRAKKTNRPFQKIINKSAENISNYPLKSPASLRNVREIDDKTFICGGCNAQHPHKHQCWKDQTDDPWRRDEKVMCECAACNDPDKDEKAVV